MITSVYTRLQRVKLKQNTYRHSKLKQFYQTASNLTAHEIREKKVQLTHFRRDVSAEEQAAALQETP
jgi:hypothetical protein